MPDRHDVGGETCGARRRRVLGALSQLPRFCRFIAAVSSNPAFASRAATRRFLAGTARRRPIADFDCTCGTALGTDWLTQSVKLSANAFFLELGLAVFSLLASASCGRRLWIARRLAHFELADRKDDCAANHEQAWATGTVGLLLEIGCLTVKQSSATLRHFESAWGPSNPLGGHPHSQRRPARSLSSRRRCDTPILLRETAMIRPAAAVATPVLLAGTDPGLAGLENVTSNAAAPASNKSNNRLMIINGNSGHTVRLD
jgi:hypothetical protein